MKTRVPAQIQRSAILFATWSAAALPVMAQGGTDFAQPLSFATTAGSENPFTRLGFVPDLLIFLFVVALAYFGAVQYFRMTIMADRDPRGAYALANVLFLLVVGVTGFFLLLPHASEPAADIPDFLAKMNWIFLIIVAGILGALAVFSCRHRSSEQVAAEQ